MDFNFKNTYGHSFSLEEIKDFIEKDYEYEVYVGTDSQIHRKIKKVVYATCIILYKKGKGGRVFISRKKEPFISSLRQRLMNEVWSSIVVSFEFVKILPKNAEIVVHMDVNPDKRWKSSNYYEELVGMVVGQGFKYRTKPDAWAAQAVADKFSR